MTPVERYQRNNQTNLLSEHFNVDNSKLIFMLQFFTTEINPSQLLMKISLEFHENEKENDQLHFLIDDCLIMNHLINY